MFGKLLIANRGEIACRVIRTARAMGIRCVAVYSDADATARHVREADEAYRLGPAPSTRSYLDQDRLLAVAREAEVDAIHPGYGFLSENETFARRVADAGIVFVGPPAAAIEAMGNKSRAKAIMEKAGVPLTPGYHGEDQDDDLLAAKAAEIGFPVLVKAAMGGGGKGMRVVEEPARLAEALQMARGEARSAFGDDRILLEKYLTRPRHVEVQIFADDHGGAIYLGDRDCSIQRRHQKIVEEAPAPGLSDELRRRMGEAAVRAAQAIDYRNAGTVEFLLDTDGSFYFMEMNTRLQVEHPVTELVTGQDLVRWQIQVAGGGSLPLAQEEVEIRGHAIEARVYAEDPDSDFMPQAGRIAYLAEPAPSRHVRIDSGVREGDEISSYYDPMIAKLVCWDESRPLAVRRINRALEEYRVVGVKTNLQFLANVLDSRPFVNGQLSTRFIEENRDLVLAVNARSPHRFLALAALFLLERQARADRARAQAGPDPHSPWFALPTWRLNGPSARELRLLDVAGDEHVIGVTREPRGYRLRVDGQEIHGSAQLVDHQLFAELDGHALKASITYVAGSLTVQFRQHSQQFTLPLPPTLTDEDSALGELTAPINGVVVSVHCKAGDAVARGATLMVIEAMKMQYSITAPRDGVVREVPFAVGDQVVEGQPLLVLDEEAA